MLGACDQRKPLHGGSCDRRKHFAWREWRTTPPAAGALGAPSKVRRTVWCEITTSRAVARLVVARGHQSAPTPQPQWGDASVSRATRAVSLSRLRTASPPSGLVNRHCDGVAGPSLLKNVSGLLDSLRDGKASLGSVTDLLDTGSGLDELADS